MQGSPRNKPLLAGLGFAALSYGAAAIGAVVMRRSGEPNSLWYRALRKPSFQPPSWLFGPVWTVLYGAIAYAGWRIWKTPPSKQRSRALGLWSAQLVLNGLWTPLFFGARRPTSALVGIAALDVAASAFAATSLTVDKRATAAVVPYLGWLGFATALNATIVAKNPSFLARR